MRLAVVLVLLLFCGARISAQEAPPRSSGRDLMVKALPDLAGKEVLVRANVYPPGTSNPPHRHDAHVFLHILEGQLVVQLKDREPVTLNPGDTHYEAPDDIHMASRNPSDRVAAKALIFTVKNIGPPATTRP